MDVREVNVLVLAYLGDTIYENYVRKHLINSGIGNVDSLQKKAVDYVSAKAQCKFVKDMIDNNFFSEEELSIIMRARNNTNNSHPKNCDAVTYKYATGLEALIGYLNLKNNDKRIAEIMNYILE